MMKKLLLLFILMPFLGLGQTFNDGVLEYTVTDGLNVSVNRFNDVCPTGDLVIPETVFNNSISYTVTSISNNAFFFCSDITSVIIPNSILNIGEGSFSNCIELISVVLPENLTIIPESAFSSCEALTNINLPDSVTVIGNQAFVFCTELTSINLPESITTLGFSAFQSSGLTSIDLPESLTIIGEGVFFGCTELTSVTLPESLTSIGDSTFRGCTALISIDLPESLISIGDDTFLNCTGLTCINLPESLTSIGSGTFQACTSLINVNLPETLELLEFATFGDCSVLSSINLPASLTSLGDFTFYNCSNLVDVTVNWESPLVISSTVFGNVPTENVILYVPEGTISDYEASSVWQDFNPIIEQLSASVQGLIEVVDDISGNSNCFNITATQLNSIDGVSGAIDGINYTTALQNATYADPNNPTAAEIQAVIDAVNNSLSLEENTLSILKLYPNPAKEHFTIQLNDTSILEQVIIYNTLGQEVLTSKDINVDTSTLASGSYIVEITTNNRKASKNLIIE